MTTRRSPAPIARCAFAVLCAGIVFCGPASAQTAGCDCCLEIAGILLDQCDLPPVPDPPAPDPYAACRGALKTFCGRLKKTEACQPVALKGKFKDQPQCTTCAVADRTTTWALAVGVGTSAVAAGTNVVCATGLAPRPAGEKGPKGDISRFTVTATQAFTCLCTQPREATGDTCGDSASQTFECREAGTALKCFANGALTHPAGPTDPCH